MYLLVFFFFFFLPKDCIRLRMLICCPFTSMMKSVPVFPGAEDKGISQDPVNYIKLKWRKDTVVCMLARRNNGARKSTETPFQTALSVALPSKPACSRTDLHIDNSVKAVLHSMPAGSGFSADSGRPDIYSELTCGLPPMS